MGGEWGLEYAGGIFFPYFYLQNLWCFQFVAETAQRFRNSTSFFNYLINVRASHFIATKHCVHVSGSRYLPRHVPLRLQNGDFSKQGP